MDKDIVKITELLEQGKEYLLKDLCIELNSYYGTKYVKCIRASKTAYYIGFSYEGKKKNRGFWVNRKDIKFAIQEDLGSYSNKD